MCRKCGEAHLPPTGKKCRRQEEEEVEEEAAGPEDVWPLLRQMKKQMDSMQKSIDDGKKKRVNVVEEEELDSEEEEGELQAVGGTDVITPATLRSDVRAMERAASRIAQFRELDLDDDDEDTISRGRNNGKKSGSVMVASDNVKKRIDWPHMHVQRMVHGKRENVPYKELKIDEFVYGFLVMLKQPKGKWDKDVMLDILCILMQDSMDFSWDNARSFYENLGLDVESGTKKWQDSGAIMDKRLIQSRTVYPKKEEEKEAKKNNNKKTTNGNLRCCALYQRRACEQNRDHHPFSHACAYCAKSTGMAYRHPEEDCFRKSIEDAKNSKKRE